MQTIRCYDAEDAKLATRLRELATEQEEKENAIVRACLAAFKTRMESTYDLDIIGNIFAKRKAQAERDRYKVELDMATKTADLQEQRCKIRDLKNQAQAQGRTLDKEIMRLYERLKEWLDEVDQEARGLLRGSYEYLLGDAEDKAQD